MMSAKPRILIVDDEPEILKFLSLTLEQHGFITECAENGKIAERIIASKLPDLVILDLGLPDMDGKTLLLALREWSSLPVIVLSARNGEAEKVEALENGADDYLTKPFGASELLARIKVALRHSNHVQGQNKSVYNYQGLEIDLDRRIVRLHREDIKLTPTEYKLLAALAKQPGKVITQNTLINEVWGKNAQGNSHYLRIYVQHLRNKLGDDPLVPHYILTDPGIGYRLIAN